MGKENQLTPISSQPLTAVPADTHSPTLSDRERMLWQDHEWVLHDPDIQRTHVGSVIAVSNRRILGAGKTHQAALESALARTDCPPREQIVTVAVEGIPVASAPQGKERP